MQDWIIYTGEAVDMPELEYIYNQRKDVTPSRVPRDVLLLRSICDGIFILVDSVDFQVGEAVCRFVEAIDLHLASLLRLPVGPVVGIWYAVKGSLTSLL